MGRLSDRNQAILQERIRRILEENPGMDGRSLCLELNAAGVRITVAELAKFIQGHMKGELVLEVHQQKYRYSLNHEGGSMSGVLD